MQAVYLLQVGGVGPQESEALAGLAWKHIGGWNSCVSFACGLFPRVASFNSWLAFCCWSHSRSSRPDRWLVFISFVASSNAGWFFVRLRSNWVKMATIECDDRAASDQICIIDTLNNVSWGLPWWLDHLFLLTQCSLAWVQLKFKAPRVYRLFLTTVRLLREMGKRGYISKPINENDFDQHYIHQSNS